MYTYTHIYIYICDTHKSRRVNNSLPHEAHFATILHCTVLHYTTVSFQNFMFVFAAYTLAI